MRIRFGHFHGFLLVSAILIALAVATGGWIAGEFFERQVLAREEEQTALVVRTHARRHLSREHFSFPGSGAERAAFASFPSELPQVFRIKVYDSSGRIVWSDEPRLVGTAFLGNPGLAAALGGRVGTVVEAPARAEHVYEHARGYVAAAYVPITFPGSAEVVGVIETYKDVTDMVMGIHRTRIRLWGVAGGIGIVLYGALALVVWRASLNERNAIRRLAARNRALTSLSDFAHSLLHPVEPRSLAQTIVNGVGGAFGLSGAFLYQAGGDHQLSLLAEWDDAEMRDPALPGPDLVGEALHSRRFAVRGAVVALALFARTDESRNREIEPRSRWVAEQPPLAAQTVTYLFVAVFRDATLAQHPPVALEIMLHGAAVALANAELLAQRREAHASLVAILAGVADRMWMVDREMRLVWMNRVAAETAVGGASALGHPCFEVLGGETETCHGCPAMRTFQSGNVEHGVRAERFPGGEVRYLDLVSAPLRDATGRVSEVLEVARDVTERVEMEQRLAQSGKRLERAHAELLAKTDKLQHAHRALGEAQAQLVERERLAAVGEVVVSLHHAILNPLTGIRGVLQVLKREGVRRPRATRALEDAEAEIRRIEQLIRRLPELRHAAGTPYVGDTIMLDLESSGGNETDG